MIKIKLDVKQLKSQKLSYLLKAIQKSLLNRLGKQEDFRMRILVDK